MNSKFIIKPTDTRGEIRLKLEQRLKYFIDSKYTDSWVNTVCSNPFVFDKSKCLNIPNMAEFVSQIRDECLKGPMLTEFCINQVVQHFLSINDPCPEANYWWTRAGDYKVTNMDGKNYARFIKWNSGVPIVFREIAEQFFTQDYSKNIDIAVIDYVWDKTVRDVPRLPYIDGFYNYHCDKLYEPLDKVEECPMLEYLKGKGFSERSHTLTAKFRCIDMTIENVKYVNMQKFT